MLRVDGIPTSVTLGVKVNEPVDVFWRRALMEAARVSGLPLLEQGWFADAFIAQFPNYMNLTWKNGQDPTPPRAPRWDDNKIKTTDFNHLLLNSYLNANRGAGRNRILPEQLRPYEGSKTITVELGSQTTDELTKWRQDFIYRGGEPGTGKEAPIGRSGLVPALQTPSATPDITHIPTIMRSKGWNEGATLMEEWFRRPASIRPATIEATPNNFGPPIFNVIRMDWILRNFKRARNVYDEMINGKLWKNAAARVLIKKRLTEMGVIAKLRAGTGESLSFGNLASSNVIQLEETYIQSRPVNEGDFSKAWNYFFDSFDGLTAALAEFNFRLAIKGTAKMNGQIVQVSIDEIGVFVKDSYDFVGDQPLGQWGENGLKAVTNKNFRDWRDTNGRGGDFLVYSDVKTIKLIPPDNLDIQL